jgi:predicted metalloendopeptidase
MDRMSPPKESRKHHKRYCQTRKHKSKTNNSGLLSLQLPNKSSIHPGNDFYTYVNQVWLEKTQIPPTKSAFGVSEEIDTRIEHQTKAILQRCLEAAKTKKQNPSYMESIHTLLGTLAESVLTADTQTKNLTTVHTVLASIQSLTSKEEVGVVLGEFQRYKLRSVFSMYGQYENKNKTQFTYTISTGGLGLPDPSYYHRKSLRRASYFAAYKKFVQKLGVLFQIPTLQCVIPLEKILAGVLLRVDRDTIEQERTGSQLQKEFSHIPFSTLFQTIGLDSWGNRIFYVESMRWLHTLNKLFHHLDLDYWKLLLSLQFILSCVSWLPPPYSNLSFQFYKKTLKGQLQKLPRSEQAIHVLEQYATPFFSRVYVEEIVNKNTKPEIVAMLDDIKQAAEERLQATTWLEEKTREKAKEKVKKMRSSVAYPDTFDHHRIPILEKENLLSNLFTLGEWRTEYELQKLGQPITQRKDWDDAVFVVNAYYYGQANEIIIPSGILQDPFYNANRSIGWNYGGIGCVLCHEITHAFDKEGKEYDPQGFQKRWWTRSDNRNYNEQTKALIELYSKQRLYGFPVSGKKTLSENIADIGGMGIALDALTQKLDSLKLTGDERKQAFRDFFTSYAVSWRFKDKKKKRLQALIMDKHAPPFLRVNLVVSQFQEWYDAFDIQPGDKLYLPPEKRIRIF